jgi:DNA-binding FadR family transcriptional regulator
VARVQAAAVEPRLKASHQVAGQLRRLILDGELADGDQLPTETRLTERFGVSRPTVREAFRILETEGLISVAHGSRMGARVNAPRVETSARYAGFALRAAGATLRDTYEAQLSFEPYAVRLLAERRTPQVMAELEARLRELEDLRGPDSIHERHAALARYHLLLVTMTGNRTLTLMAQMLAKILETHQARCDPPLADFARGLSEAQFRDLGPKSIRKLLGIIQVGDADAAEAHWREHLRNATDYWLAGADPGAVIDIEG